MKKIIRLNESDLRRIVNRVVRETTNTKRGRRLYEGLEGDESVTLGEITSNQGMKGKWEVGDNILYVTLDNDVVYKRSSLLIVPKTTVTDEKNVIVKVNKQNKINRNIDKEGLDVSNIVSNKRRRNILLNTLDNNNEKVEKISKSELSSLRSNLFK